MVICACASHECERVLRLFGARRVETWSWTPFHNLRLEMLEKFILWLALSRCCAYRPLNPDLSSLQQEVQGVHSDDDDKSLRTFAWSGFTEYLRIHKGSERMQTAQENIPTPFLSIAGKAQNSACKVVMYRSLGREKVLGKG